MKYRGGLSMRITDVLTVLLTGPCTSDPFLSEARKRRSAAFIEIHTDSGITGVGETYAGYFIPEAVPPIVDFFKPILIGQSPEIIHELWSRMYRCGNFWGRTGLGLTVINGIEAALWDLKGKALGLPVYELLGGRKHEQLPCYATGGPSNYPKEKLAEKISFYLSEGFKAVKIGAGCLYENGHESYRTPTAAADFEADKISFLRSEFGRDLGLAMDAHMGNSTGITWNLATAKAVMGALEPFDLLFFEEPLHYTDPWGYAELCRSTSVPIAGGECLTGMYEWRVFTGIDSFDIGQPDASFTGGLGEFLSVASLLESRGRSIAAHAWGAGGSLMQNIHCGFACANTLIMEIPPAYGPLHREIVGDCFVMKDGMVLPPDTPGLGINLSDEVKSRFPFVPGSGEFNSVEGKILTD